MKQPEFPGYSEKAARGLIGPADLGGGLCAFLGLRHVDAGPGVLRAEVEVRDELKTPFGNLHGGVLAALCDHVLGTVCYPVIPRGAWAATTEFKLNYLAPVSGGTLRAESQIVSMTRTTAIVRVEVSNGGRLACIAQGTLLLRDPKPAA